jgi:Tfp pilus assembly protein PilW
MMHAAEEKRMKRNRIRLKNSGGFTLIVVMATLAILGIALIGIYEMVIQQQRGYLVQEDVSEAQQDIRVAMEMMASEIRMAGMDLPNTVLPICPAIPACTDSNPDSITINLTSGASTFLVPNAGVVTDGIQVFVQSVDGFLAGIVNIIRPASKALISSHTISGPVVSGPPAAIPLGTPSPDPNLLQAGDMVVMPNFTVTYDLVGQQLRRNGVVLAENIQNLQFSYILNTGTESNAPPANSRDIQAVRITVISSTTKAVSQLGGANRNRQLSTVVKLRNLEL